MIKFKNGMKNVIIKCNEKLYKNVINNIITHIKKYSTNYNIIIIIIKINIIIIKLQYNI